MHVILPLTLHVFIDDNVHFHMSSFSETVALGLMKNEAIEFVKYPLPPSLILDYMRTLMHVHLYACFILSCRAGGTCLQGILA